MEHDQISLLAPIPVACLCALALGCSCGPSSPERDASSAVCVDTLEVLHLLHKGRAAREEVLATALPASICTTSMCYNSSAPVRLVVNL